MVVIAMLCALLQSRPEALEGPKVGAEAPDFKLKTLADAKKEVKLSDFKGKKPVVLIFGSYT